MKGIELTIDLDESLYLALRLRAAQDRADPVQVVKSVLRRALTGELAAAQGAPPLASVLRYALADSMSCEDGKASRPAILHCK
jgi:hypothetical protein